MNSLNGKKEKLSKIIYIFLLVVIVGLSFLIFANSMTKDLGHDEHMYCTAGYLIARGELIYRDFSYVAQMPLHPLLLGLLYKIIGTDYYLLTGRLLSVVFEVGILICIIGICKHILKQFPVYSVVFAIRFSTEPQPFLSNSKPISSGLCLRIKLKYFEIFDNSFSI